MTAKKTKSKAASAKPAGASSLKSRLAKLGLVSRFDLILHLPLRYEDETRITPMGALGEGGTAGAFAQVEGEVVEADIQYRPRRTLIVRMRDATGVLVLRFLNLDRKSVV